MRHPHLLQGLRAGRLPGRVRRRAGADRGRAARGVAAVRRLDDRPGRGDRLARARSDELLERVDALVAERARVVAGLREVGWDVPEAQGNFVWFELGDRTAEFAAAADEVGIVVRPFAGEGARVSIGEDEANDRLVAVAAAFANVETG